MHTCSGTIRNFAKVLPQSPPSKFFSPHQVSTQEQALVWQSISRAASLVTRSSTLPDLLADAAWKLLGQEGLNSLLGEGAAQGGGSPSGTAGAASLSLSALM